MVYIEIETFIKRYKDNAICNMHVLYALDNMLVPIIYLCYVDYITLIHLTKTHTHTK